jgi:hypothetical protein
MSKSLLEQLPEIVRAGKRQAQGGVERPAGQEWFAPRVRARGGCFWIRGGGGKNRLITNNRNGQK